MSIFAAGILPLETWGEVGSSEVVAALNESRKCC